MKPRRLYLCSDLHLSHSRLCLLLRGMPPEESDALIIENWNKVVRNKTENHPGDKVYILGDISLAKPELIEKVKLLNGEIVVVGGNHDSEECCRKLNELGITVVGCVERKGYLLTHVPIHPSQLEHIKGNIHGHIHLKAEGGPKMNHARMVIDDARYYNINIELHNYTPILFDKVIRAIEEAKINSQNPTKI